MQMQNTLSVGKLPHAKHDSLKRDFPGPVDENTQEEKDAKFKQKQNPKCLNTLKVMEKPLYQTCSQIAALPKCKKWSEKLG